MTPTETVTICRLVAAMCPQQKFDSYTPQAWGMVIGDIEFEDARRAVVAAARESAFISPADIVKQVNTIELERLRAFGAVFGDVGPAPQEIADDGDACSAWAKQRLADIRSGRLTRENDPLTKEIAQ